MLGFGLLGSAVSSFVQEGKTRAAGGPLVSDLPAVLIRGFSAAIVVFLAAEGGLAIISGSGTVDPNPYILMFTCFGAAVFSQTAWDRVREKLEDNEHDVAAKAPAANRTEAPEAPVSTVDTSMKDANTEQGSPALDKGADSIEETKKKDDTAK
jgi:hypothetical protein